MKIPYAVDLSPEDGADSVERAGDHADSPYFAHPDVYNMESTDTLTVLHNFKTHAADQRVVLRRHVRTDGAGVVRQAGRLERRKSLAALRHSLDGTELEGYPGTTLESGYGHFQRCRRF